MTELSKIFGAVSRTTSLMRLSALLASKLCRCRNDGFCSEQERHGLKQNPTYKKYVILEQAVPDKVIRSLVYKRARYLDEEQERATLTATLMYYAYMSCRERGSDVVIR